MLAVARRANSSTPKPVASFQGRQRRQHAVPPPKLPRPNPLWYVPAMAIDVSRPVEERFQARLRDGTYGSADELLDDALRLLEQREAFRQAVAHGLAQANRGELRDGEERSLPNSKPIWRRAFRSELLRSHSRCRSAPLMARVERNMGVGCGRASDWPSTTSIGLKPYLT